MALSCKLLDVSRSGLYDWECAQARGPSQQTLDLEKKVQEIFKNSHKTYGRPRILAEAKKAGFAVGGQRIRNIMGQLELVPKGRKRFIPKTTINNPSEIKSERVFKIEEAQVTAPNEVWVSDLTYIQLEDKSFGYLVTVMDLYNREIKGWDFSDSMEAERTKAAMTMAIKNSSGDLSKTIFHSDQGIQYCAQIVRDRLQLLKMVQSMSRKGNCYDNAFAESFFSTLKREISGIVFVSIDEGQREIKKYLDWYNQKRIHSSLGNMSPVEYAQINRDIA